MRQKIFFNHIGICSFAICCECVFGAFDLGEVKINEEQQHPHLQNANAESISN